MKKSLIRKLGVLGVVSFLSYAAAVIFSPLAYEGYNPLAQAVSDLSAADAPSLMLWNRLSALYNVCETACVTVVCIAVSERKNKLFRRMGFRGRVPRVPAFHKRLCEHLSGRNAHSDNRGYGNSFGSFAYGNNRGGGRKIKNIAG